MNKHVIIFEARGGTDKGPYGYRVDSKPIADSLKEKGWTAEIIFYSDEDRGEIYKYTVENACAYISRVNPGFLKDETGYFQMLNELVKRGIKGLPHPHVMIYYGAKNAIEKLKGTDLVPEDVFTYYDFETFKTSFPKSLTVNTRVLKQNRGSTGEGIWRVELTNGNTGGSSGPVSYETEVKCTEARDNHVEVMKLGEFIDYCVKYLDGDSGMLLDMPYLDRIKEGEIRVFMLRNKVVYIVHKKPVDRPDAFSATLFSGATYTYDSPDNWPELVELIEKNINVIIERLGNYDMPLIWTADFILDTDEEGNDKYVLGEINASCVGFSTHLDLGEQIADEIIMLMEAEDIVHHNWMPFKN